MAEVARNLQQHRLSPLAFCEALLRYSGLKPRQDFTFAVLCCQETYELLHEDICRRLGFRPTFLRLSPEPDDTETVRAQLSRDTTVRCLLTTYLNSPVATSVAREFALSMIMIRLNTATARILEPAVEGVRGILTRDRTCAEAFRRVLATIPARPGTKPLLVAAIDEGERVAELRKDASDVYVSPLCLDRAKAVLGADRTIHRLPAGVSDETMDDILFHYVTSEDQRPRPGQVRGHALGSAVRPTGSRPSRS